jgi:hypothetical protein
MPEADKPPSVEEVAQAGHEALAEINKLAHGLRDHMETSRDYGQSFTLIAEFFAECGYLDIAEYIGYAALAFSDTAAGVADPLFSRRVKKLKRDPTQKWRGRMWAVFGFDALVKTKMSQAKAVGHIATNYPELKRLLRGNRNLQTSLPHWHVEFINKGKQPPQTLHKSFSYLYKEAFRLGDIQSPAEYREIARNCLRKAVEIARSIPDAGP